MPIFTRIALAVIGLSLFQLPAQAYSTRDLVECIDPAFLEFSTKASPKALMMKTSTTIQARLEFINGKERIKWLEATARKQTSHNTLKSYPVRPPSDVGLFLAGGFDQKVSSRDFGAAVVFSNGNMELTVEKKPSANFLRLMDGHPWGSYTHKGFLHARMKGGSNQVKLVESLVYCKVRD